MRDRWDLAPAAARARGDAGNRRLHERWVGMLERKKRSTIANVAIARELAGWCWSLAVMDEQMDEAATGLVSRPISRPAGGPGRQRVERSAKHL